MRGLAGASPPDVHIVGFGQTVNVFSSKQRPKELTIYGSDFKWVSHNSKLALSCVEGGLAKCHAPLARMFDGTWCGSGDLVCMKYAEKAVFVRIQDV